MTSETMLIFILTALTSVLVAWRFLRIRRPVLLPAETTRYLSRVEHNPILAPRTHQYNVLDWESAAVLNPAAVVLNNRVHLLYRAMGNDGVSRIGYASSTDGVYFDERDSHPAYVPTRGHGIPFQKYNHEQSNHVYTPNGMRLTYDTVNNPSGGGWAGAEDPRMVVIENRVYVTFVAFDGWGFVRMALTSIDTKDFTDKRWNWSSVTLLSPPEQIHKNWILFPEKIYGKFAIIHSISPKIEIEYRDSLESIGTTEPFIESPQGVRTSGREGCWDSRVRGAGAPPLKTPWGWLLFYHGMDPKNPAVGYKVGAMLLDLDDPSIVLFRSPEPVLTPEAWYENDGKPGVVYVCGSVIVDDDLIVYYGGGDKHIAAARTNLETFIRGLVSSQPSSKILLPIN